MFAASRVGRDAAEDLAQEVLVLLHEKYPQVTRLEELLPLSFQILRFKLIGLRRKAARAGEYTQVSVEDIQFAGRESRSRCAPGAQADVRAADRGYRPFRRPLPRPVQAEIGRKNVRRNSRVTADWFHQHGLYVGCALPQTAPGIDGRKLGERS